MKKFLVVALVLTASIAFATSKECIFHCGLTQKDFGYRPIEMSPVGGYTTDMNTSCVYKNDNLTVWVTSKFGYRTKITLMAQGQSVSMEAPQNEGRFILEALGYEIECVE